MQLSQNNYHKLHIFKYIKQNHQSNDMSKVKRNPSKIQKYFFYVFSLFMMDVYLLQIIWKMSFFNETQNKRA